jgi:hypothetical protein
VATRVNHTLSDAEAVAAGSFGHGSFQPLHLPSCASPARPTTPCQTHGLARKTTASPQTLDTGPRRPVPFGALPQ